MYAFLFALKSLLYTVPLCENQALLLCTIAPDAPPVLSEAASSCAQLNGGRVILRCDSPAAPSVPLGRPILLPMCGISLRQLSVYA